MRGNFVKAPPSMTRHENRGGDLQLLQEIMADDEKVENVILGGSEPGKYIAWELARQGRRTVVVESLPGQKAKFS
jgi:hypothetical protein